MVFETFWRDQAKAQDHKSINTLDVLIPQWTFVGLSSSQKKGGKTSFL